MSDNTNRKEAQRRADEMRRDRTLRDQSAARAPRIAPLPLPSGFLPVEEAAAYVQRRWGRAVSSEKLRAFMDPQHGPKPYSLDGGETYYAYDEVDLWVYRTLSGVPASWRETQGRISMVPVRRLEDLPRHEQASLQRALDQRYQRDQERGLSAPDGDAES
jgi:hypothetical protein